ncbi:MAG: NUDIX domain-containing protein [Chloroflexi bacterium]|nr:NUDIX domain-containing protein [Chloroflexota bacterium]
MMWTFCPECGQRLTKAEVDGRVRSVCSSCHFIDFGLYSLGAGGIIINEDNGERSVLLIQRNRSPGLHLWTIPGGYIDHDEIIEHGIVREIREETGLETEIIRMVGYRNHLERGKNDSYVIFLMRLVGGHLVETPNEEIAAIGFFAADELETLDNLSETSRYLAMLGLDYRGQGFTSVPIAGRPNIWVEG